MRRFRKNKKGFSLVELIIVVAIMVALIAVMAPAYVKYVTRSHDAVVEAAAESVLQYVKAEIANGSLTGTGKIKVYGKEREGTTKKYIYVDCSQGDFSYQPDGEVVSGDGMDQFLEGCGVDDTKQIKSNLVYEIEVYSTQTVSGHPTLQTSMDVVDPENP